MGSRPRAIIIVGLPVEQDQHYNEMLTFNGKAWEDAFEDAWDTLVIEVPKSGKVSIDSFYCGDEIAGVGAEVVRWDWDNTGDEINLPTLNQEALRLTPMVCYAFDKLGVPKEMIEKVKTFVVVDFS